MNREKFEFCFCFQRRFKIRVKAEPPEDVKELFEQYSENGSMTVDQLQRFLVEVQGERDASKEHAQAIFNSAKHLPRRGLRIDHFFRYLLSDSNYALRPSVVHQDMNAPLAHYFMFTGHNSYLTGNQLSSDCSEKPIIDALKRGVRVIELDLWPDSGDDVEVRHGGALTKPVELVKCLKAIKDNAFLASEYPVVITFEDHLHTHLQAKVARMVTQMFGDMLYRPRTEHAKEFPSPESLKRKILISTKPPKEYLEAASPSEKDGSERHIDLEEDATDKAEPDDEFADEENPFPSYKSLIAIPAGKPKHVSNIWLIDPNKVRRISLSEQELVDAVTTNGTDIVRFTQKNLLRVYPKGTRLDSSNYNPMLGWLHGAQMVALNMQGHGKFLWIMQGMFGANGGCGYVKKPDFLLYKGPNDDVFDPSEPGQVQTILKVKVYHGEGWHEDFSVKHFDRYSPPDFFVRVGIAGFPQDQVMKKTEVIEDEWIPTWNQEFEFPLRIPELAILRIEAPEYDTSRINDFGGQTYLPVSELRSGIRAVPLRNRKGDRYKSVRLLMRFEFVSTA